jgi:hypothetical protein
MRIFKLILSALTLLSLISCMDSEPSDAAVTKAVTAYLTKPPVIFGVPMNSPEMLNVVHSVQKLSCSQLGSKEYTCLVQVSLTNPILKSFGPLTQTSRVHLVKKDSEWLALNLIE